MGQEETLTELDIFPWNDNFVTGIEAIDEQHRQLVALLNRLALHYANRSGEAALEAAFDELAAYADYHFRTEEAVWSEHLEADSAYRSHLATHHRFIGDVLDLKKNEEGKAVDEVIYGIVAFLSKWLAFHILDSDKRMAKTVIAMQEGADAEAAKRIADEQMSGITKVLIDTVLNMYENLSTSTLNLMREKALRRQAEEELNRSEERWQVILEGGGGECLGLGYRRTEGVAQQGGAAALRDRRFQYCRGEKANRPSRRYGADAARFYGPPRRGKGVLYRQIPRPSRQRQLGLVHEPGQGCQP